MFYSIYLAERKKSSLSSEKINNWKKKRGKKRMSYISTGKIIKYKKTGEIGFIIPDVYGLCSPSEALVNFEGDGFGIGIKFEDLEVIHPEMPEPDPEKCGMGKGEKCCIFLNVASDGFRCERFTSNRRGITLGKDKKVAQRHPVEMYPDCQLK